MLTDCDSRIWPWTSSKRMTAMLQTSTGGASYPGALRQVARRITSGAWNRFEPQTSVSFWPCSAPTMIVTTKIVKAAASCGFAYRDEVGCEAEVDEGDLLQRLVQQQILRLEVPGTTTEPSENAEQRE